MYVCIHVQETVLACVRVFMCVFVCACVRVCVNVCVCGCDVCFNDCVPLCLFSSSEVFCRENRTVLKTGDTLKFPKLAETMETVAEQGANVFYTGSIGRDLIHDIKASGGWLGMWGEKIDRKSVV